jgi:hypothetical protein
VNGCVEVVKVLLEFGAQVDLPNDVRWHCEFVIKVICNGATERMLYLVRVGEIFVGSNFRRSVVSL